jgi:hypothetical protein
LSILNALDAKLVSTLAQSAYMKLRQASQCPANQANA